MSKNKNKYNYNKYKCNISNRNEEKEKWQHLIVHKLIHNKKTLSSYTIDMIIHQIPNTYPTN